MWGMRVAFIIPLYTVQPYCTRGEGGRPYHACARVGPVAAFTRAGVLTHACSHSPGQFWSAQRWLRLDNDNSVPFVHLTFEKRSWGYFGHHCERLGLHVKGGQLSWVSGLTGVLVNTPVKAPRERKGEGTVSPKDRRFEADKPSSNGAD